MQYLEHKQATSNPFNRIVTYDEYFYYISSNELGRKPVIQSGGKFLRVIKGLTAHVI
jgi:hypothetical protein